MFCKKTLILADTLSAGIYKNNLALKLIRKFKKYTVYFYYFQKR